MNKKKNIIIVLSIIILILVISILSYTYAYFAFSANNSNTVTGNAGTPKIDLTIDKIVPNEANANLKLVPLLDNALSNALLGTGGQSSCIDSNGNLSCQIYKITIKNSGSVNLNLKGTIELIADGTNNIFGNLKWRELENTNTIKSGSTINGMTSSSIVENVLISPNESKNYYFALWLSEINEDQSNKDYGEFHGNVTFNDVNGYGVTATFNS